MERDEEYPQVASSLVRWEMDPGKAALLVVDMQRDFCAVGAPIEVPTARSIVPNVNRLAQGCREAGIPVVWIRTSYRKEGLQLGWNWVMKPNWKGSALREGSPGAELYDALEVKPGDHHVHKCRYSAFIQGSSSLERLLRMLGRDTLIITGVATNVCCESTARDAMMLDFKVVFLEDANAAFTEEEHMATVRNMKAYFAQVSTVDELLHEMKASGKG